MTIHLPIFPPPMADATPCPDIGPGFDPAPAGVEAPVDPAALLTEIRAEAAAELERLVGFLDRLRAEAETEIARLVAFLDVTDTDPDLEDDGSAEEEPDEPSLGWTDYEARYGVKHGVNGWAVDLEDEHDGREPDVDGEPDSDGEPSLGSRNDLEDQSGWASGGDSDREPDLGSFDRLMNQVDGWKQRDLPGGMPDDAEAQPRLTAHDVELRERHKMAGAQKRGGPVQYAPASKPKIGNVSPLPADHWATTAVPR